MEHNYLEILEESLKKKSAVLDEIILYNKKQEEMLKDETAGLDEFDAYADQKDILIQKLLKLDEGFESVYEHVREELQANRQAYRSQIMSMQTLISQITDKSVLIQAQEARNKALVEQYIAKQRKSLKENQINSQKAYEYYQNLTKTHMPYTGIMDQKK